MTNSSKRAMRSSLFATLPKQDLVTEPPCGPDAVDTDEDNSQAGNSQKRFSLNSIRALASPASKRSSKQSSPLARSEYDDDRPSTSPPRRSSPIPIPLVSPAPAIHLQIESGSLSPSPLFACQDQDINQEGSTLEAQHTNADTPVKRPLSRIMSRKRPKSSSRDKSREQCSEDPPKTHIPRRASADHWRMRDACRKKSRQTVEHSTHQDLAVNLPSPMPGTNLLLDDPFDSTTSAQKDDEFERLSQTGQASHAMVSMDGVIEIDAINDALAFANGDGQYDDRHRHDLTQHNIGPHESSSKEHHIAAETILLEAKDELKQHIENMRIKLSRLRKGTSSAMTDSNSSLILREVSFHDEHRHLSSPGPPILQITSPNCEETYGRITGDSQHSNETFSNFDPGFQSPVSVLITSTRENSEANQSPLATQCLFYGSSDEEDDDSTGEHNSVLSEADQYLYTIRAIASNGVSRNEDDTSTTARVTTSSTLETLIEDSGESPSNDRMPLASHSDPESIRSHKRRRSSFFNLVDYWKSEAELKDASHDTGALVDAATPQYNRDGKDRGHQSTSPSTVLGPSTIQTSPKQSPPQSIRRRDSDCFIPICDICGSRDDHVCLPALSVSVEAQQDGAARDHNNDFGNSEPSTSRNAMLYHGAPSSGHADSDLIAPPTPIIPARDPLQHRASSSQDFDPFFKLDSMREILQWSTNNPFEPLSRCETRDHQTILTAANIGHGNGSIKSHVKKVLGQKKTCISPEKTTCGTPKVRPHEKRERSASFRSDTDLDSDVDDTNFPAAGVRLDIFNVWM